MTANLGSKSLTYDSIVTQAKYNSPFTNTTREKVLGYTGLFWEELFPNVFNRGNFIGENNLYKKEENDLLQFESIQ